MDKDKLVARLQAAQHAHQTGIGLLQQYGISSRDPKHLRVGIDSAMVEGGAIVKMLVRKGIMTHEEYLELLCEEMEAEVERDKVLLRSYYGKPDLEINLV